MGSQVLHLYFYIHSSDDNGFTVFRQFQRQILVVSIALALFFDIFYDWKVLILEKVNE